MNTEMITHQNSEIASITNQHTRQGVYPVPSHISLSEVFQGIKRAQEDIRKGLDNPSFQPQQQPQLQSSLSLSPTAASAASLSETIRRQSNCEGEKEEKEKEDDNDHNIQRNKEAENEQPMSNDNDNDNNIPEKKEVNDVPPSPTPPSNTIKTNNSSEHLSLASSSSTPIPMDYNIDTAFTTTSIVATNPWAAMRLASEQLVDYQVEFDQTATMRYSSFDDGRCTKKM